MIASCRYFWALADCTISLSFSRTRAFSLRMFLRIAKSAGEALSAISSSL